MYLSNNIYLCLMDKKEYENLTEEEKLQAKAQAAIKAAQDLPASTFPIKSL